MLGWQQWLSFSYSTGGNIGKDLDRFARVYIIKAISQGAAVITLEENTQHRQFGESELRVRLD